MLDPVSSFTPRDLQRRTVRPIGSYALTGLASDSQRLLAVDSIRGYLLQIDCATDNATILNSHQVEPWIEAVGLSIGGDRVWFAKDNCVYWATCGDWTPHQFLALPYPANGVAVWQSTVYVSCQKAGYVLIHDMNTGRRITQFPLPGVGEANLMVRDEELWVCDRTEQTVYCMDRATGAVNFSILTPFASPSALAFHPDPQTGEPLLYVAYCDEEVYIRDDPNSPEDPYEVAFRDRTFLHPLHFYYDADKHYTLSNGYRIEMSYVEEILTLEEVPTLENLEWRMALPSNTPRQTVLRVEPVGMPFTEEEQDGQKVAVFRFDQLAPHEGHLFGWKALLEVRAIKYWLTSRDVEKHPPLPKTFHAKYLVDDDDLAMDSYSIQQAAKEAIGTETNLLRKMLKIRNYVYDRISYGIKPHIDTPDVALERGVGSCGEYVGIILALARLNGIACRTVGRYKCPPYPDRQGMPLQPDFNHVWIEFYIPGIGWLPMESNVDDVIDRGPYPTRFFMGLPWYHAEMGKGIPFEKMTATDLPEEISIGDVALNHIRFTILEELPPPGK